MEDPATSFAEDVLREDWNRLGHASSSLVVSCHSRQGLKLLEHFQPHVWAVENRHGRSIASLWRDPELRQKATDRSIQYQRRPYKAEIRRNLAFYGNAPLPTFYRPLLTKGIVAHTRASKVLDCSVGWGGRMLGTLIHSSTTFTGIEPCTATYTGLCRMADFLGIRDRAILLQGCAEDILPTLPSGSYDLVLTSPPYFDLEIYSHEPTQSTERYKTWEDWVAGFLTPVLRECLRCLTSNGISAWSIKNMGKHKLRDLVIQLHASHGFELKEIAGMTSCPRNTGKTKCITEETLLFQRSL